MDQYVVEKVIGEGTYGIVYKAKEKSSGDYVAIKKFKTASDEQLSKREVQACSMLSHPNIVCYRNSFRHDGLLHLVFDFVSEGMIKLLCRNKKGVDPQVAQKLTYQLCQALQYCHANRIIHRDVKPDNILMDEQGDIKLCDFGVARTVQFEGDPLSDYVATRWYRPPEQELRMDRYSFDADIWSVGCVLVELLTGRPLFPGNTQIDQINLIQEYLGPLPTALLPRLPRGVTPVQTATKSLKELLGDRVLPDGTLDFLASTLQLEPKLRLSAAQCLQHPFLRSLRDVDLQERETRRRAHRLARLDEDDGIEEDIPGEKHQSYHDRSSEGKAGSKAVSAKAGTPPHMHGPRSHDFKEADSDEWTRDGPHAAPAKPKQRRRRPSGQKRDTGDNNTECDSDDIQELIEVEESLSQLSACSRQLLSSGEEKEDGKGTNDCKPDREGQPRTKESTRRRPSATAAKHGEGGVGPLGVESDYEDDFEDYPY